MITVIWVRYLFVYEALNCVLWLLLAVAGRKVGWPLDVARFKSLFGFSWFSSLHVLPLVSSYLKLFSMFPILLPLYCCPRAPAWFCFLRMFHPLDIHSFQTLAFFLCFSSFFVPFSYRREHSSACPLFRPCVCLRGKGSGLRRSAATRSLVFSERYVSASLNWDCRK